MVPSKISFIPFLSNIFSVEMNVICVKEAIELYHWQAFDNWKGSARREYYDISKTKTTTQKQLQVVLLARWIVLWWCENQYYID